jgi:glycosyltransferase involved in cell wall biosynthesis
LGAFKALIEYINISIHWIVHKLILIQLIYDYVTAVSYVKARKNHVRAIVIPNPTICRSSGLSENPLVLHPDEVLFITYVSPGVRITNLPKLVKVVYLVNKNLERLGVKKRVVLHVYEDVPPALLKTLSRYPFVKFMGYVSDFIKRLSVADIFLDGFPSAELGHTALESICVGVPVAKFTEDPRLEEVVDGFSGILAISDEEMVEKLTRYVLNMDEMKKMLVSNARISLRKRDLRRIAIMWRTIIGKC